MKKLTITAALTLALCIFLMQFSVFASFPTDYDALVYDSTYFKDRGFDTASSMIEGAKNKTSQSYILVFYSRYDYNSKKLIPEIQQWAEDNQRLVNGIDQHNRYTAEYGYFNSKTSFVGWDSYIPRVNFSFPAVFVYNADTRIMTAKSGVQTMDAFTNLLEKAGVGQTHSHDIPSAEKQANQLNSIGLFKGTGVDFELERSPLRVEALIMLIRVLGKEQEALILDLPHPFTDVPSWASPYVGYAYANGLTAGISETLFGTNDPATSAQYLTFILRALGYVSEQDFQWYDPYALSLKVGILPDGANINEFFRADMVMITKSTLSSKMKGLSTTLGDRLVNLCSITPEQYKSVTDLVANYTSVQKEFKTNTWNRYIRIEPKSPEYTIEAIHEVANYCPSAVYFVVEGGKSEAWAKYIQEHLAFSPITVKDFHVSFSDSLVLVEFEYAAAPKILSHLFLKGYEGTSINKVVARITKGYLSDMTTFGAEAWITEYLNSCQIVSEESSDSVYTDADSALSIQIATSDGIEGARYVLKKLWEYRDHIILS